MQETSGAYARMSFDLEEVRNHCSDTEHVEFLRFIHHGPYKRACFNLTITLAYMDQF